jgi:hypothetical protein
MALSRRIIVGVLLLLVFAGVSAIGASAQSDTTGISISAYDCDSSPRENPNAICAPSGGTVINVSLDSGEFIGSCTLETNYPPFGGVWATCGVDGVPFNSTLVIAEDPESLPAGYVPINSPQTFEVGDTIPGGGDETTVGFTNVLQEGSGGVPPVVYRRTSLQNGSCEALEEPSYYPLYPVVIAEGEPVGQAIATEAETSHRTVDNPLDTLIDEPHAIVVYENLTQNAPIIACGEIGGMNDHDGELVIGLREMNDSGFVGMAKLSYNAEDAEQTDVAVYLAQGLQYES